MTVVKKEQEGERHAGKEREKVKSREGEENVNSCKGKRERKKKRGGISSAWC